MILYRIAKYIVPPFFKFFYRYRIINRYDVPKGKPVVLCSNHIALVDPFFLAFSQHRPIRYMAKRELFENKFLGALIRILGAFSVDRSRTDMTALDTSFQLLEEGEMLGIFVEGTRSKDGELLKPKAGAAMIAYKAGCDVLPVVIVAKKGRMKMFRKVIVNCGRPMSHADLGFKEGTGLEFRNATRTIWKEVERLQKEAREQL